MLKIGITGGIGSGKTTVCRIFETLGIPVFYADDVAKEVMVKDMILVDGLKEIFGKESYTEGGGLDRKYIANIVFNDHEALSRLNGLVHPAVFRAFDQWLEKIGIKPPYILKEAALLFETGSYKFCDQNILVTAPLEMKLKRVMARDGLTAAEIRVRMDKQLTDEQKMVLSDYIISNDETKSLVLQVLDLHRGFLTTKP
jgi:dephospho-CoA kinase